MIDQKIFRYVNFTLKLGFQYVTPQVKWTEWLKMGTKTKRCVVQQPFSMYFHNFKDSQYINCIKCIKCIKYMKGFHGKFHENNWLFNVSQKKTNCISVGERDGISNQYLGYSCHCDDTTSLTFPLSMRSFSPPL